MNSDYHAQLSARVSQSQLEYCTQGSQYQYTSSINFTGPHNYSIRIIKQWIIITSLGTCFSVTARNTELRAVNTNTLPVLILQAPTIIKQCIIITSLGTCFSITARNTELGALNTNTLPILILQAPTIIP